MIALYASNNFLVKTTGRSNLNAIFKVLFANFVIVLCDSFWSQDMIQAIVNLNPDIGKNAVNH